MGEGNVENRESSAISKFAHVLMTPFGSQAYKESRERGQGRLKSVINGLIQACMPATYGMAETISNPNTDKDQSKQAVGMIAAVTADVGNNWLALTIPWICAS